MYYTVCAELPEAREIGEHLLRLAESTRDNGHRVAAHTIRVFGDPGFETPAERLNL